jgi:hypothetical protein
MIDLARNKTERGKHAYLVLKEPVPVGQGGSLIMFGDLEEGRGLEVEGLAN